MSKSSASVEKSKNRLRKHQGKREGEREKAREDGLVEISMSNVLDLGQGDPERAGHPPVPKVNGRVEVAAQAGADSDEDSGANSEVEEQEQRLIEKKRNGKSKAKDQGGVKPFSQRDLVSLAFAGDKVVQVRFPPKWSTEIDTLCSSLHL